MNIIHEFQQVFMAVISKIFMVYKPMKTQSFMGCSWVHYFIPTFHGYFITHEKNPTATFMGIS